MKLTMQFFFKSETYDESVFAWFLGGLVLKVSLSHMLHFEAWPYTMTSSIDQTRDLVTDFDLINTIREAFIEHVQRQANRGRK